jgi:ABC-type multidrug transport system ATPase subunit
MLCGENGSIDIGDFLKEEIKGPASFECSSAEGAKGTDGCKFKEPAMDGLINQVFGDDSITLNCGGGECLYKTEVPGYSRPVKEVNTPLIAGVIAGCSLFVVLAVLGVWYFNRRQAQRKLSAYYPIGSDTDDETGKLMSDHKPAALYFQNINYHLNGKQILNGIQGVAHPGQLMAIMGASGAGKTTFLDILARKNKRGVVEGDFYINGEKVSDAEYRSVIGFVDQEDTMLPTLTVHETILNSALLRLPRDMGIHAKEQRVYEVEKQLGIHGIKDQIIGSEEGNGRGVSGGEKRRVSIACELVTSPSILFLDEPTSGLDAYNAFNVIECLVTLAKTYNRTVVFTIHQPRSNIVALFDHLVLLAKGKTVYSGEFSKCQEYFQNLGYDCPPGFNIADYLVDLSMHAVTATTPVSDTASFLSPNDNDGTKTMTSSVRGVKSIPGGSIESGLDGSRENLLGGSPSSPPLRPKNKRRASLKQRQDKELFTRKRSGSNQRLIDEVPLDSPRGSTDQWLSLSQQRGSVPSQILDDLDELPPAASGTGTDLDLLTSSYANSDLAKQMRDELDQAVGSARDANGNSNGDSSSIVSGTMKGHARISLPRQFIILSGRTWKNLYRNPMLMLTHYAIAILLAGEFSLYLLPLISI